MKRKALDILRRVALLLLRVLDVACGTGDLAIELRSHGAARITGLDFCRPMLDIADRKSRAGDTNGERTSCLL